MLLSPPSRVLLQTGVMSYLSGSSSIKGGRRRRLVALAPADSSRGDGCGDAPAKDAYEET